MTTARRRGAATVLSSLAVAVAAAASPLGQVPARAAAPPPSTSLASRFNGSSGTAADQGGFSPSVSTDGRFVAFESRASLTGEPTGGHTQVYVRDRKLSTTVMVSRPSGTTTGLADNNSDAPAISGDGRFVAFESSATNLVAGFTPVSRNACDNGTGEFLGDVYLRDLQTNTTTLISHVVGSPTTPGNHYSEDPVISSDGSTVAYDSAATDVGTDGVQPDRGCEAQGFVHKAAGDTTVMLRGNDQSIPNGQMEALALSGDGNHVAFVSGGTNLNPATTTSDQAYVRHLLTLTTDVVSRADGDGGAIADAGAGNVAINGDGTKIAFSSESTNLGVTATDCPGSVKCQQVYLRSTPSPATTTLVSQTGAGATGDGDSGPEVISADGNTVAFETAAPNLGGATTGAGDEITQVIVRDVAGATTTLVSRAAGSGGAQGNQASSDPAISRDGQSVAFESAATNLSGSDTRNATQVWVRGSALEPDPVPPPASSGGYDLVTSDGVVYPFGSTGYGSLGAQTVQRRDAGESARFERRAITLNQPIVGMASVPGGGGYWLVAADGGIFPFGAGAGGYGSTGNIHLNKPIVGMAASPSGRGYWLVASDGGIFPFGDAVGYGSTGNITLNKPIVGMAAVPGGGGYWLVASDGGIFPFGPSAVGYGSLGNVRLNQPVVGMAASPRGGGYWLVASDGGIFPFGPGAVGYGSTGNVRLNKPIVGMAATRGGRGYWLAASDGGIFPFGDAVGLGSLGAAPPSHPVVGIAPGT